MTTGRGTERPPDAGYPAPGATQAVRSDTEVGGVRYDDSQTTRRDRVRWGSIWAGLAVALGTYLLLQLALVALDITDLADPGTGDAVATAVVAGIAFLLGGITVGASAMWRGVDDGVLHGIIMWATALLGLIALSALGSGVALGAIDTSQVFEGVTSGDVEQALGNDAQETAGWALLGLAVALVVSAIGGAIGSKMWPGEHEGGRVVMSRSTGAAEPRMRQETPRERAGR